MKIREQMSNCNDLKEIDEIDAVGEDDFDCLAEINEVLERHGRSQRFGVTLLHKHFDLGYDEVMLEETDLDARKLVLNVVTHEQLNQRAIVHTNWRFVDGSLIPVGACASGPYGGHYGYKD